MPHSSAGVFPFRLLWSYVVVVYSVSRDCNSSFAGYESAVLGIYCIDTVMRLRLRLLLISLFILVLAFPLLACPKRIIFQFSMFPRMI